MTGPAKVTGRPRRRKGRRGKSNDTGASLAGLGGVGTPRYLATPKATSKDVSSASEVEARNPNTSKVKETPVETPFGRMGAELAKSEPAKGRRLDPAERGLAEARLGADFSDVRVAEDDPLATALGVDAMTYDGDIRLAKGQTADPDLLGHELAHVEQQRQFGALTAQYDVSLGVDGDSGLGQFSGVVGSAPNATPSGAHVMGMVANFEFLPHELSPYSNRLGFIQTVDMKRLDHERETDVTWGPPEQNRENVKTPSGAHLDMLHGNLPADRNTEPWYWQGFNSTDPEDVTGDHHFGWNRAPDDRESAAMRDGPGAGFPARFSFETIVVGRDSEVVYGAIRWGFDTDGVSRTDNEFLEIPQITSSGTGETYQSDEFEAARQAFREFYVHEPIIVYFGFDERVPTDPESAKLSDAATYMAEHPDALIRLTASADMQGGVGAYNARLALDRMSAVQTELLRLGVPADRIVRDETGAGASRAEGSADRGLRDTEGSFKANRRVTVTFENTRSRPP